MEEEERGVQRYRRKKEKRWSFGEKEEIGRGEKEKGGQKAREGERKKAPCVFLGVITDADLRCHLQHG